jgi:hypothetical protein
MEPIRAVAARYADQEPREIKNHASDLNPETPDERTVRNFAFFSEPGPNSIREHG